MKKQFLSFLLLASCMTVGAQNIQIHYDLGHSFYSDLTGRPNVTTTFEMFKPDKWSSTFMFTDIDYFSDGAAGAYWEISREFNLTKNKQWALHLEYDGGATTVEHTGIGNRFQHAFRRHRFADAGLHILVFLSGLVIVVPLVQQSRPDVVQRG